MKTFINVLIKSDVEGITPDDIKAGVLKAIKEVEGLEVVWSAPAKEAEDRK